MNTIHIRQAGESSPARNPRQANQPRRIPVVEDAACFRKWEIEVRFTKPLTQVTKPESNYDYYYISQLQTAFATLKLP